MSLLVDYRQAIPFVRSSFLSSTFEPPLHHLPTLRLLTRTEDEAIGERIVPSMWMFCWIKCWFRAHLEFVAVVEKWYKFSKFRRIGSALVRAFVEEVGTLPFLNEDLFENSLMNKYRPDLRIDGEGGERRERCRGLVGQERRESRFGFVGHVLASKWPEEAIRDRN